MTRWFNRVSAVIGEQGGIVDKFIGDCVFARWESAVPEQDVVNALRTACLINRITGELLADFPELGEPLRIGAGIHTGLASLGIGSGNTVLGDSVNTAFRLESASKELGVEIVLSENAFSHLPRGEWGGATRTLKLKGKSKPVPVVGLTVAQGEALLKGVPG
jgi:adenylate cyclase